MDNGLVWRPGHGVRVLQVSPMHLELEPDDRVEAVSLASLISGLEAVPLHFLWLSPSVASTGQTRYCSGLPHIPSACLHCGQGP